MASYVCFYAPSLIFQITYLIASKLGSKTPWPLSVFLQSNPSALEGTVRRRMNWNFGQCRTGQAKSAETWLHSRQIIPIRAPSQYQPSCNPPTHQLLLLILLQGDDDVVCAFCRTDTAASAAPPHWYWKFMNDGSTYSHRRRSLASHVSTRRGYVNGEAKVNTTAWSLIRILNQRSSFYVACVLFTF